MTKRIAVLGAGFIGGNLIRDSLERGYSVKVFDRNPCPANLQGQLSWTKGDLGDEARLRAVLDGCDIVFHLISSTVPGDIIDESGELKQNVFQTLQLLHLCVELKVGRLVFVSSSSVYGPQDILPISEDAPTDPISSHGIHKLAIEKYLQLYTYRHQLDCRIARLSNPFGPGQKTGGRQGLIGIVIGRMRADEPVVIHGDGTIVRDFIYIDDVIDGLQRLAVTDTGRDLFNIGSGTGHSLNDVIAAISRTAEKDIVTKYAESRFTDIQKSVLDVSRAQDELGFRLNHSFEYGLAKTLEYHGFDLPGKI